MELQYISDASGNHTVVVIPIKEWEELTKQHEALKKLEDNATSLKPSDFAGSIPEAVADAMQQYVAASRENW
jgi:hypothetical protein